MHWRVANTNGAFLVRGKLFPHVCNDSWEEVRRFTLHKLRNLGMGRTRMEGKVCPCFLNFNFKIRNKIRLKKKHFFRPFANPSKFNISYVSDQFLKNQKSELKNQIFVLKLRHLKKHKYSNKKSFIFIHKIPF